MEENTSKRPVAVVTGGTGGIGRAAARRFAREGWNIGLVARGEERLDETREELAQMGAKVLAVSADVANYDAVEAAAQQIEEELGEIEVWVNNAMTSVFAPVMETEPDEYRRVMDVCYLGYVHGTKAALKRMKPRNRGHIILVGSAVAYRGIPLQSAYSGAKHAIQGFFDSLRAELLHDQSSVVLTMVQMPAVNTPRFNWCRSKLPNKPRPISPVFQPEEAAAAIYFASQSERREVWVGGSTAATIVANRLFPGVADQFLAKRGYEAQMTDEPVPENQQDNLYAPAEGRFAAHGDFDSQAKSRSAQFRASKHKGAVFAAVGGVAVGVAAALLTRPRR